MGRKDGQGGADGKAERLAEALRENLRRRKAQARKRTAPAPEDQDGRPGQSSQADDSAAQDQGTGQSWTRSGS